MRIVSVVIPTLDAGVGFEELLRAIRAQKGDFDIEVVVVDSGSSDGTPELARRFGAEVHSIPKEDFDHGGARDIGISLAKGEFVALTVQDAVPLDEHWLASMAGNMSRDERVAGVYGRQIPHPSASPLARVLVRGMPTSGADRVEQFCPSSDEYRRMAPEERRRLASFDDVNSCVRRSVWEEVPFGRGGFGEDLRWAKRVVESGRKLVYEPEAAVLHSHERSGMYALRRHYVEGRLVWNLFGLSTTPSLPRFLANSTLASASLFRRLRREENAFEKAPRHAMVAVRHAFSSQAGAYLSGKVRRLGGVSPGLANKLDRLLGKGV